MINDLAITSATFAEHIEGSVAFTFALVFFTQFDEFGDESSIKSKWGDMAGSIDTESVDAHFDELPVALYEVIYDGGVFGVKVDAVAGDLTPPTGRFVPVPLVSYVVIVVVGFVVATNTFQIFEAF